MGSVVVVSLVAWWFVFVLCWVFCGFGVVVVYVYLVVFVLLWKLFWVGCCSINFVARSCGLVLKVCIGNPAQ